MDGGSTRTERMYLSRENNKQEEGTPWVGVLASGRSF